MAKAELQEFDTHTQLLDAGCVDAVIVAVPPYFTAAVSIDCIEAGVHVLIEKPMGNTEADARLLLEASRSAKGTVMVAENFFFVPGFVKLREIARSGDWPFGKPLMVALHQFWKMTPKTIPQFYHSPWRHDARLTHGYLIEGGCHTANPIREAFGMVQDVDTRMLCADSKLGKFDTIVANGTLADGTLLQLTASYGMRTFNEHFLQVFSEGGTISVHGDRLELMDADGETRRIETPEIMPKHDYRAELFHFHDVICNRAKLEFKPVQAYGDILFMQKLIDGAKGSI